MSDDDVTLLRDVEAAIANPSGLTPPWVMEAVAEDLRARLGRRLAWMGPDYRQAVNDVMDEIQGDSE